MLPDTYGTEGFLARAPEWLAKWTGIRIDSGDPANGAETAIRWWQSRGEDPRDKLVIFSDGLDSDKIAELQAQIDELRHVSEHNSAVDLNEDIRRLENKNEELTLAPEFLKS